jgi:hypothetical protein
VSCEPANKITQKKDIRKIFRQKEKKEIELSTKHRKGEKQT